MKKEEKIVLIVSGNKAVRSRLSVGLRKNFTGLRMIEACNASEAKTILFEERADVIVFDTPGHEVESSGESWKRVRLATVVTALAIHAPVIVLGDEAQREEVKALIDAGVIDFAGRGRNSAAKLLEVAGSRLSAAQVGRGREFMRAPEGNGDFGETLRHELNNPLTGILGNAELLLAEIRRKEDGKFPSGGQQCVETIAVLAVRLRETIRRLSQEWETRNQAEAEESRQMAAHG
jgi:signal transduction histidine kinase